jgi:hypothetical protein
MAKLNIQVNGETIKTINADISLVEIRSSQGYVGEFSPDGLSRVNIVVKERGNYAVHIDDVVAEPVEIEVEKDSKSETPDDTFKPENKSTGFNLPTED